MKKVIILCHRFLDFESKKMAVGGVETYAGNLVKLLQDLDYEVSVYQLGNSCAIYNSQDEKLHVSFFSSMSQIEHQYLSTKTNFDIRILLSFEFGHLVRENEKTIIVQHGIEFDGYTKTKNNSFLAFLQQLILRKQMHQYNLKLKKMLKTCSKIVCVDLNFINYVRVFRRFERYDDKLIYIPNFSDISESPREFIRRENTPVEVLIPRRFEYHRGILLYSEVVDKLLKQNLNVHFHFVGEGTYDGLLKKKYANENKVSISRANHEELMSLYGKSDICVIPTIYSEGTSLSAIEAMANMCTVIVTNVGGLGNLVFPNYNGYICEPTVDSLYKATLTLIQQHQERERLSVNAYEVVKSSFSNKHWRNSWTEVIQSL